MEWGILSIYCMFVYKLINGFVNYIPQPSINNDNQPIRKIQPPRKVIIVRRTVCNLTTDIEIRRQIAIQLQKDGYTLPYFLSTFSYPNHTDIIRESRIALEVLNKFLVKLYTTNHTIVIMNRNQFEWEYEPYLTACKMYKIQCEICDL